MYLQIRSRVGERERSLSGVGDRNQKGKLRLTETHLLWRKTSSHGLLPRRTISCSFWLMLSQQETDKFWRRNLSKDSKLKSTRFNLQLQCFLMSETLLQTMMMRRRRLTMSVYRTAETGTLLWMWIRNDFLRWTPRQNLYLLSVIT